MNNTENSRSARGNAGARRESAIVALQSGSDVLKARAAFVIAYRARPRETPRKRNDGASKSTITVDGVDLRSFEGRGRRMPFD